MNTICPRCAREQPNIHTCTPSAFVRDLEQRLEYALRNLAIVEKARQEEMVKRDELLTALRAVTELANDSYEDLGYATQPRVITEAFAAIAKAAP